MTDDKSMVGVLEKQGWTMRFVANEPRLSEAIEMYKDAGFEILLKPLPKDAECKDCPGEKTDGECRVCFDGFENQYRIIFTRPLKAVIKEEEDLF